MPVCFLGVKRMLLRRFFGLELLDERAPGQDGPVLAVDTRILAEQRQWARMHGNVVEDAAPGVEDAWESTEHTSYLDEFRDRTRPLDKCFMSIPIWVLDTNIPTVRGVGWCSLVREIGDDDVLQPFFLADVEVCLNNLVSSHCNVCCCGLLLCPCVVCIVFVCD